MVSLFRALPSSSAAGCAAACARSGRRGIQLRGCPPPCGLPLDAAAPNAPPAWSGPPSLGALLLARDQAAVVFSSAAVLRPAGSPLMPLRRTPRRPDPARLRQGCGKAALRYRDLCCHARPRSGLVQSVVPSLAALRLAANQSAASRVPGPHIELGVAGYQVGMVHASRRCGWLLPGLPRFRQGAMFTGGGWGN